MFSTLLLSTSKHPQTTGRAGKGTLPVCQPPWLGLLAADYRRLRLRFTYLPVTTVALTAWLNLRSEKGMLLTWVNVGLIQPLFSYRIATASDFDIAALYPRAA